MGQGASRSIQESVLRGDSEAIREFAARRQIDAQDEDGWTALHFAAFRNAKMAVARQLLQLGASVNLKDKNGRTPLHLAAASGNTAAVTLLCGVGADANALDNNGVSPLCKAASAQQPDAVRELLAAGADPRLRLRDGTTPLHLAAWKGHVGVLGLLLEHALDIDATNDSGNTALHEAAVAGHVEAATLLLENNADPTALNEDGQLPGGLAESNGHQEVAALLAAKHAQHAPPQRSHLPAAEGNVSYPSVGTAPMAAAGVVSYAGVGTRAAAAAAAGTASAAGDGMVSYPTVGHKEAAAESPELEGVVTYPSVPPRVAAAAARQASSFSEMASESTPAGNAVVPSAPPLSSMHSGSRGDWSPPFEAQRHLTPYDEDSQPQDVVAEGMISYPGMHLSNEGKRHTPQGGWSAAAVEGVIKYPSVGRASSGEVRQGMGSGAGTGADADAGTGVGNHSPERQEAGEQRSQARQHGSSGVVGYPSTGRLPQRTADDIEGRVPRQDDGGWGDASREVGDGWGDPVGLIRSGSRGQPAAGHGRQGAQHRTSGGDRRGGGRVTSHRLRQSASGRGGGDDEPPFARRDREGKSSAAAVLAAQLAAQQEGRIAQLTTQLDQLRMSLAGGGSGGSLQRGAAPDVFCCPITQDVFEDPVLAADGFTYERSAIERWFCAGHETSPMTNAPLTSTALHPNHALRSATTQFLSQLDES